MSLTIQSFHDPDTGTWSYIVSDSPSQQCAIIDPVLDYDLSSGQASYSSANKLIESIQQQNLELIWILETHAHADHLTAADYIKQQLGGQIVIGKGIQQVQTHFAERLNLDIAIDGSQFDRLVDANETLALGDYQFIAHPTPGHTDDSMSYQIENHLFIGDTFFHPQSGTARCDFPGGNAEKLFNSLQFLLSFPDDYKLWLCHDYPNGRDAIACTTVGEQKDNVHLQQADNQAQKYTELRNDRDATLNVPKLIYPALQVNIRAGQFPEDESNGAKYLKIPFSAK